MNPSQQFLFSFLCALLPAGGDPIKREKKFGMGTRAAEEAPRPSGSLEKSIKGGLTCGGKTNLASAPANPALPG
jgi:hypothetical protein